MEYKVFGFIGAESYDLIFYAAKMATELGYTAIMIDLSSDHSLSYLYSGAQDPQDLVEVNGVALKVGQLDKGCLAGYQFIFIYYGTNPVLLDLCHEIYLVTDFQRQNIEFLKQLDLPSIPRFLVLRNRGACSFNYKFLVEELQKFDINEDEIFEVEDSDGDILSKILLQYSTTVKFSQLSSSIKDFVKHILDTDVNGKVFDVTWRKLVKG